MDFIKLFRLEDKKNALKGLEEINLRGKEDSEIRKTVLGNFSTLFPHLELYNGGKQYVIPYGFRGKIKPDSLAYCESEKRLYILEYKSRIDENMIRQILDYRASLQNNNDNLHNLKDKWNEQVNKHRKLEDFKVNKAKIICIAPEFDVYAVGVEEEWEEEIQLIKITKYKTKKEDLLILLQSRDSKIFNSSTNENVPSKPQPQWINKLKGWIDQIIEPWVAKNYLTKKGRRGGGRWDFRKINQEEVLFSICYRGRFNYLSKPGVFLVNPSEFLIKKYQLEGPNERGGHFCFIETEINDGFRKAENLLTEFVKEKG